ncbi:MAG: Hint domain-containing protein [Thalassococcus sp.]|uniref:Hint domain-containing protein n=1 Tax=Thalassococcus sp. TaxID=1928858 RepID=UPI001B2C4D82|nr:Hint domain-containing protein [Thalassococcus sp.]MBO6867671.1 Hint domain-containing protein [Thalassococcus sp.]
MVRGRNLPIDTQASAIEMAETIFGDGVTVVSATYTGDATSSGIYTDGDRLTSGVTPSDVGVILSTGDATDFTSNNRWQSNLNSNTSSNTNGVNNDPWFNAAAGTSTYDASYIEVDFIPTGDVMTMQFVFSSEEYPEYESAVYQDFVGVWVNGQQVEMTIGDGDADPNNLNSTSNQNLYVDNTGDQYNTEMDGFTVTMTLTMNVNPGEVNTIRIGIADVVDSNYDSNLLIAADSVQTSVVAITDTANVVPEGTVVIDVLSNDINQTPGTLTITQINGQNVSAGDSVTLATGQTVTLNADGTLTFNADADEEIVNFTYAVESDSGITDTAFVTVNQVPCFVAGTMIETIDGPRLVEDLKVGDLVLTQDNGFQPMRWVGSRTVEAKGDMAPIEIARNTFGIHERLQISPLHRLLVREFQAELMFGDAEVLIAAKYLVNDDTIRRVEGKSVTYFHLMFDAHEIVFSNGLASESFLPGPMFSDIFEQETLDEICEIFPELDPQTGAGYSEPARRILRAYEAQVLGQVAA